jgi:hypothetical protein
VKSFKTYLILLLTLTTIGGSVLAWRQYAELVELRAIAMNREERADLNKRVWDLEKANRELQDRLAAARGDNPDEFERLLAEATADQFDSDAERPGRGGRRGGSFPQMGAMRDLMNKPEIQAMVSAQQKARIDRNYAALFRNLNLSSEQSEKLKTLLAERQTTGQDIIAAAHAEGINPRDNPEAIRKLFTDARNQIDDAIKSVIGDTGFAQLQNFEQTMPQRNLVNDLQQRLSYSDTPLSAAQADQLVQILATNAPPIASTPQPNIVIRGGFGDAGMSAGMFGGGPGALIGAVFDGGRGSAVAPITPAAIGQAQAVLSEPQLGVLQQLQQQQLAQQQLAQMIRETVTSSQPASTRDARPANSGLPQSRPSRGGGG